MCYLLGIIFAGLFIFVMFIWRASPLHVILTEKSKKRVLVSKTFCETCGSEMVLGKVTHYDYRTGEPNIIKDCPKGCHYHCTNWASDTCQICGRWLPD